MNMKNMKHKARNMKQIIIVFILIASCFMLHVSWAQAANMESDRYRIKWGNVNIGAKDQSSSGYSLKVTMGQTAAGVFTRDGYIIKAGFQYHNSIIPFRFSITSTNIDLGTLIANQSSTAATHLTVSFGSAGQYQVTATEIGPLQTMTGNSIPDTSCNGGGSTCSETAASVWTSTSAYGFGYNMTGHDIPADFIDSTYYRPFPDRTASETPAIIMSNVDVGTNRQATMTFKANISAVQPAGSYDTIINLVATPSF